MSRYRKIDTKMWGDKKFRRLTNPPPSGRYCWIYLLTNRETIMIPGLYRAYEETLARDLEWPLEGFREAFAEPSRKGMVKADWEAGLVWVPNAIRYNPPENPNVVKSWAKHIDDLPECPLKYEALQALKGFVEGLGKGFAKAFPKGWAKGMRKQEQDQEQEQEGGKGAKKAATPPDPSAGPPDFDPDIYKPQFQIAMANAAGLFKDLWGQKKGPRLNGDNLTRALEAWTLTDCNALIAAVHGHRIQATKEGSKIGRQFRLVFPEAREEGERVSHKLCCDRFMEFVEAGRPMMPDPVADARRELERQAEAKRTATDDEETKALIKRAGAEGLKGKDLLDAIKKQIRKERDG